MLNQVIKQYWGYRTMYLNPSLYIRGDLLEITIEKSNDAENMIQRPSNQ